MSGRGLGFGCSCGAVRGTVHTTPPARGNQLQCHCDDCRRAIVWLGQPDPGPDGVCYFQTAPSFVTLVAGHEKLGAFTWKSPRLVRWYAACCNTPLFNTLDSPKWAFASIMVARLDDPASLGPVTAHAFVQKSNGKRGHVKALGFMWGFARRVAGARLTGSWRETPFFDDQGRPRAPIRKLTKADRDMANL